MPISIGHKGVRRSTGHIMVRTRYSNQPGSKSCDEFLARSNDPRTSGKCPRQNRLRYGLQLLLSGVLHHVFQSLHFKLQNLMSRMNGKKTHTHALWCTAHLTKKMDASKPSEHYSHPLSKVEMWSKSSFIGGNFIGRTDKNSSWHLIGFPNVSCCC